MVQLFSLSLRERVGVRDKGKTMTTQRPLISIYMPTWNRQQLAIRAIKSVLRQDYDNWELIIVDDCSSSYEQLQKFVEDLNDPRVVYTHNAINSGGVCGAQPGDYAGERAVSDRYRRR